MLPGANSGMKRIKCGWTQLLFRKVRNHRVFSGRNWRVKTELIIITILHIIIITTSILNLGSKTFAPKILAHTTCINGYWKYTQIFSSINQAKLIANSGKTYRKNNWAELTTKIIKYWRLPKILLYTKMFASNQNVCAHPQNICAYPKIFTYIKIFAPPKYSRL